MTFPTFPHAHVGREETHDTKRCLLRLALMPLLLCAGFTGFGAAESTGTPQVRYIILKADDFMDAGGSNNPGKISDAWKQFFTMVEQKNIKATLGIIGSKSNYSGGDAFWRQVNTLIDSGRYELWNHGYTHVSYTSSSLQWQINDLRANQDLVRQKTGRTMIAAGMPENKFNPDTYTALNGMGDIKFIMFGDASMTSKTVLARDINIEYPTFTPDYERFVGRYPGAIQRAVDAGRDYFCLQIHPNSHTPYLGSRQTNLHQVIDFLKSRGHVFVTFSEYLAIKNGTQNDLQAPSIPAGLSVRPHTATSVLLFWNDSTDNMGVAGYDVYYSGALATSVTGSSALLSGLTPGVSYSVTVKARDLAGNVSGFSQPLTVMARGFEELRGNSVQLAIAEVTASAYQDGNPPAQSIDGDVNTRWSAEGNPQTITYRLADPATLKLLRIAFFAGDQRATNFTIQVSGNGQDWTTVESGPSSGLTSALEIFDVGSHANVGWVRYVGQGNTVNDWNSLLEVELWGTVADSSPAVTYAVTYHTNGATSGTAPSAQTKTHDTALTLATNSGNLARTGFQFAGWNTAANGSGTNYATAAPYAVNAGVTLYAKWTAVTYAVTYHANGATSGTVPPAQAKTHGVALTLATNSGNLTQTGSTFTGWNTDAHASGTSYPVGARYSDNTELMLYAQWSAESAGPGSPAPAPAPDSSVDAPKASSCGVGTAFGLVLLIAGLCFRSSSVRPRSSP